MKSNLGLDSVLAKREMSQLLLLTDSLLGLLERSQSSTHGTGLLDTEIQRSEALLLVEKTKLFTLGLVDNGQNTGNVLTGLTTIILKLISWLLCGDYQNLHFLGLTTSNLLDTDVGKLLLLFVKDLDELGLVLVTEFVSFDGNLMNSKLLDI